MPGADEKPIRLDDVFYILLKHKKIIVGFALIGLLLGSLISLALYIKGITNVKYYITASIAVSSETSSGLFSSDATDPNSTDIHLAEDLTDSVIYVCKSDRALNAAAEKLSLIGVTADDIKPNLSLSQYEETQIVEMTLIWDNSEEGMMILNAITEVVPNILIDTLKIGDVTIVNEPKVKSSVTEIMNIKVIAVCILAGAVIGAGIYLVKFFIHPTYLHSEDIKKDLRIDILAEIPKDAKYFSLPVNSREESKFSATPEYFVACAHVLVNRLQDLNNVCMYITSSAPQEGKTSMTANISYALASLGYKTLVIDMDLRNPSLASKFNFKRDDSHYINSVYNGTSKPLDAVVKINDTLDLLPAKIVGERIVVDDEFQAIISTYIEYYDFVIIDTAPVGQVSDALSLNQIADCALFVIRQDQVWETTVQESMARLDNSGITTLGAIVNDTGNGADSYYSYNSGYRNYGSSQFGKSDNNRQESRKTGIRSTRPRAKQHFRNNYYYDELDESIKFVKSGMTEPKYEPRTEVKRPESKKYESKNYESNYEPQSSEANLTAVEKINLKRQRNSLKTLYDKFDITAVVKGDIQKSSKAIIEDTICYSNLPIDTEIIVEGSVYLKETGDAVVTNTSSKLLTAGEGEFIMSFIVDTTSYVGKELVVFERIYAEINGRKTLIAEHADIGDENQMVTVVDEVPDSEE